MKKSLTISLVFIAFLIVAVLIYVFGFNSNGMQSKTSTKNIFTQEGTYVVHDGDSFSMIGESGEILVSIAPGDAASFPYVGFYNNSMNEELNLRESENGTFGKNQNIVIKVNSIDISSNSANVTFYPLPL